MPRLRSIIRPAFAVLAPRRFRFLSAHLCAGVVVGTAAARAQPPRAARPPVPGAPTGVTAFVDVTVIPMDRDRVLPHQTVLIDQGTITALGPTAKVRVPTTARYVDGRGKFLLPGLWDMHVHVDAAAAQEYPRYVAHGVTGLREMAQRFPHGSDSLRVWQREVMAGARVGPRVVGPSADLTNGDIRITTPEDAARVMDSLKAAGVVFVKYHGATRADSTNRALFFAMAREARRVGLPLVGHTRGFFLFGLPRNFTPAEAADSGMRSLEHAEEDYPCWGRMEDLRDSVRGQVTADSPAVAEACARTIAAYLHNGTWRTLTLVINEQFDTVPPSAAELTPRARARIHARNRAYIRQLHRLGFQRFLAGSDESPLLSQQPGHVLHRAGVSLVWELVLLTESGLTPLEALQAATLHPAQYFAATDSLGTVARGKLADLVLLDADPLTDIRNTTQVRAVVANGRYFDRAALDALDPDGARVVKQVSAYPQSAAGR